MLLNSHSYYSMRYGALSVERLLKLWQEYGYTCGALTDINNSSAAISFMRKAPEYGIKPVLGIDFRNSVEQQYVGLAKNNQGFRELNAHLSHHLHEEKPFTLPAPEFEYAFVIYPFGSVDYNSLKPHEYIGISPRQAKQFSFSRWDKGHDKLVILHTATFQHKRDYNAHRLLRAIDNNTLLSKLPASEQATEDNTLLPRLKLLDIFSDYPHIVENTEKVLSECNVSFTFRENQNKKRFLASEREDRGMLDALCKEGLHRRYKNPGPAIRERIKKELRVIHELGFGAYFLINYDIVQYAKNKGYYHVGRGSGANSIVAYLLGITDVDPIELDLYFERFINSYRRQTPPDFDIDFSWADRDDVTGYIFKKHSHRHTALLGAFSTFKDRAVIRQLGKVFGLPAQEISKLQSEGGLRQADHYGKLVIKYSNYIRGFPSHVSIHASGIVISEKPVHAHTSTFLPPKNFPTTHIDMHFAEDIGLYKFDILSQRGLGKIRDSLEIIEGNRGEHVDIYDINRFKRDKKVRSLLKNAEAIGCFYVESPAMRSLLTKLKTDDYKGLVAASSIIRPGVSKSGMMREYILRFQDEQRRAEAQKALPELYALLEETYGVMVYQEDVIKVAHFFGGLTLKEADILRRGMSWKFRERSEFWRVKDRFFENCRKKGHGEKTIQSIWEQIESFANYAFAKGHSASYAVESFQALFLKAYYPLEYLVATLNNGGGFYSVELYIHEARMHGAVIHPPCVNRSQDKTTLNGKELFLGLAFIGDIEGETKQQIIANRERGGVFQDLEDFLDRVPVELEQLRILIRVGAFRFSGKGKKELLWDAHYVLAKRKKSTAVQTLFQVGTRRFKLPELYSHAMEDAFDELELLGFPVSVSPFDLIDKSVNYSKLCAADLRGRIGETVKITGYLVHRKNTSTHKGAHMQFGTFIDLEGKWIDSVHFPNTAARYRFNGYGCYELTGKVTEEFGFVTVEVKSMKKLPLVNLDGVEEEPASA